MNPTSQSLVFAHTLTSVAVAAAFVLVVGGLAWMAWERSGYRASTGLLEALRVIIAIGVAVTLNQPEWREIFEPKTVMDKVDVASDTQMCLPAVFDLVNREVIWADIALTGNPRWVSNVAGNLRGVSLMLRAITGLRKTDLYTLFALHARARGEVVTSPEKAQTVFAVDRGVTPFDLTGSRLSLCRKPKGGKEKMYR